MEKTGDLEKDLGVNSVEVNREKEAKLEKGEGEKGEGEGEEEEEKRVGKGGFTVRKIIIPITKASSSSVCESNEEDTEKTIRCAYKRTSLSSESVGTDQNFGFEYSNLAYPGKNKGNHGHNNTLASPSNLIRIPIRDYPSPKPWQTLSEDLQKPIKIPPVQYTNPDFLLSPDETQLISLNIKEILDQLFTHTPSTDLEVPLSTQQQGIKDQFTQHKKILYEKTKKQFISLIKSTKSEMASLSSLENFMLSQLNPSLTRTPAKPPESIKPNPPQLLFNFNKNDGFITRDFAFTQHLRIPFTIGSSILVLDNNSILMACAETSELITINLTSNKKTKIVDLPLAKKHSGLSYINGKIALIGGNILGHNAITDSVEILNSFNEWETIARLNWPRSHCQAIEHKAKTYVFAGYPIEIMTFVEKYNNGKWEVLKFRLSENFACFGLTSFGNEIFYFGGISKDTGKLRNFLGRIDPDKDSGFVEKAFDNVFVSNCANSSSVVGGKFYYVDCIRGRVGFIQI